MKQKPKVIKDYDKLTEVEMEQIKLVYPLGFTRHLIEFNGMDGIKRKGLPVETEDKYYLIRMTEEKAINIIAQDDDYDKDGKLKEKVKDKLEDKYDDEDFLNDYNSNADNDLGSLVDNDDDDF